MNESLYIAATGMNMQQKSVDTIANNLANVNTPGFKKGHVNFEDLVYQEIGRVRAGDNSASLWHGGGVAVSSLSQDFTLGDLKNTGASMALAIKGDGFLEVSMADGSVAYSRGGTMAIDKDGFLGTADGHAFKPAIYVGRDAKEIVVNADGQVMARSAEQSNATEAGHIELAHFTDASGLVALGSNLYQPSQRSGDAIYGKPGDSGIGTLAQGFVENSNVQLIQEMVDLMAAQRAYESSVKVIQASDEMLSLSNNLRK